MKAVFLTLLVYCALAAVALVVLMVLNSRELAAARIEVSALEGEVVAADQARSRADVEYFDKESQQRRERMGYTGEQAVQASLDVQAALARRIEALKASNAAQERLDTATATFAKMRMRYLPLWILLLVHLIAGLALLPYVRPKL